MSGANEQEKIRFGLNPEPLPDILGASDGWKAAWKTHWITFVILFTFLGFCGVFSLFKSRKRTQKIARYLCYAVYPLIILFTATRTVFLLIYPQELESNDFNKAVQVSTRVLFRLGFPCLTASFAFIDISFIEVVRGKISYSRLRNIKFLIGVVVVHFAVDLIAAGLTSFVKDTTYLYILCLSYYILVVVIIIIRITLSGRKILIESRAHQIALEDISKTHRSSKTPSEINMNHVIRKVRNVIIMTWISALLTIGVSIFSVFSMGSILAGNSLLQEPWSWFIHQTFFRVSELLMVVTILYALQPTGKEKCASCQCCLLKNDRYNVSNT